MAAMSKPYYVTTPIYYVNDKPHIGHAYTSLATDVLARWKRLEGQEVFFLTGTDEHGQKVEKAAQDAGMDPQSFTDRVSQSFRVLAERMGFSNDDFIRTTEPRHKAACQELWRRLADRGEIYLGAYEGWYAVRDEAFYGPDELIERDGVKYAPSGAPVAWVKEPSYFFRLSKWQDWLLRYYEDNRRFIAPESRRNEVISFIKGGLSDLSISRTSFRWGIPVPGDEAHVMYVWLDALTNYITAAGYPDESHPRWKFWPADVHFVGKDIIRFHTIYWPAFLEAAGLAPPKRVFAHGWWTNEGQKISKSLGNVIDPLALIDEYGLDPVRYFLLREVPFGNDGDFSRAALAGRTNGELADALGNLANRTLSLIQRNCEGKLPAPIENPHLMHDTTLHSGISDLREKVGKALEDQQFHSALEHIMFEVRYANSYITQMAPWALKKTDPVLMLQVLRLLHDALRVFGTVLWPFMPTTMDALLDQLGVPKDQRKLADLATPLPGGIPLPPPSPLFRKIELAA
ncbi:methionine--tRNA ligase [Siccirubricoccus sp. KC 17139]|uniref:Methionine--tRNA ligase n=1 Tax=Siccirubricoccus soli TaxID=2899147 RepID=A0ABT1D4W4_9PROT|nr:methionine--tRNA ligase [Siccirubricoccus soli]MCO6416249.1 methionine--tRNA ligase [Siccirubricoccus soli]MCP2682383.1 methionine--tRNA ligase [Siccirubricoccus soli]